MKENVVQKGGANSYILIVVQGCACILKAGREGGGEVKTYNFVSYAFMENSNHSHKESQRIKIVCFHKEFDAVTSL